MTTLWAAKALLPSGWAQDVTVTIDKDGRISDVASKTAPSGMRLDLLLPAPVNAHSHAFQRAMAGLTEARGPDTSDSFWTWRHLMYHFLNHLDPDQVQAITALVQMEMLEAGYATSVEFHYLHHAPDGTPYNTLSEMAQRVVGAADQTGIGLTLLPVQYQFGGCDRRSLGPGQIRFGNNPDRFAHLVEDCRTSLQHLPADARFGIALHSLRAVAPSAIINATELSASGPIHMHLAEQVAEVEEVQAAYGARPVEWLLDQVDLAEHWCLIHCTQMQPHEITGLARTGAIAGLCPITESNLGDGIFDGVTWMNANGAIAIGSDSNIRISLAEELRTLDYSQRLRDRSRAALASPEKSTGRRLYDAICCGGGKAAGRQTGQIAPGHWADLLALDGNHHDLQALQRDTLLDTYIFAGSDHMVCDVWSAGRHMVQAGRHVHRDSIIQAYSKTVKQLRDAL